MMHRALAENGHASSPIDDVKHPPSGEVAFLMTDIEGSTRLWDTAPAAMRESLRRHDEILERAIESAGGYTFCRAGDSFAAAFEEVGAAFGAAVAAQRALWIEPWPDGAEVKVRMAVHYGKADERDGNYFGPCLNRCSRLLATVGGGSIALSSAAEARIGHHWVIDITDNGLRDLDGLADPEHVFHCEVTAADNGHEAQWLSHTL